MSKNTLLISIATLKACSAVHENVDDKILLPIIKVAQDTEILPALGSALFRRLQAGIAASDLSANEQRLLSDYITDALVWFTVEKLPITSSYQLHTKGVVRKSSDNTEMPSASDLLRVAETYRSFAENYRERLIRYLYANADKYPQYQARSNGEYGDDVQPSRTGYSAPCWLGDD